MEGGRPEAEPPGAQCLQPHVLAQSQGCYFLLGAPSLSFLLGKEQVIRRGSVS